MLNGGATPDRCVARFVSLNGRNLVTMSKETTELTKGARRAGAGVDDAQAQDLKRSTTRGAVVWLCGQASFFVPRTGSKVIMEQLLTSIAFGLVGIVTNLAGFVGLFKDAGMYIATVQRASVTHAQISTLFWSIAVVGGGLAMMYALFDPALVAFYGDPRLFWVGAFKRVVLLHWAPNQQQGNCRARKCIFPR
jgi:lipid-A-disaccharide synthase-like uncharacterized protein